MGPVVMIVGVLLMVVIHEAGHFVAAKAFNMKATEAFFGFGPKLWSTQRGETEYGIKALPLGGYVRIIGMNPFEEVAPEDEGRTYREKPFWQKAIVVLAGIASHFVIAFFLFYALAVAYDTAEPTVTVAAVSDVLVSSSAVSDPVPLALEEGDRVVSVGGVPIESIDPQSRNPGSLVDVVVDRDGSLVTLQTTDTVVPTPAILSGIQDGDMLVAVQGVRFTTWDEFVDLTHARPGMPTTVTLDRDGRADHDRDDPHGAHRCRRAAGLSRCRSRARALPGRANRSRWHRRRGHRDGDAAECHRLGGARHELRLAARCDR